VTTSTEAAQHSSIKATRRLENWASRQNPRPGILAGIGDHYLQRRYCDHDFAGLCNAVCGLNEVVVYV
jgi:hypothetical protein